MSISLDLNECDICHHDDGEELVKCSLCEEPEEHPVHEGYSEILHTDMRAHRACFERDHEIHRMSTPRSLTPSALSALGAPTHLKRSVSLNASSSAMYEGLKDVISKMTQIRAWVGSTNKELNKEKEMNTLGVTSYQDGMYRCLSPNERRKKFAAAHFERTPRKSASHPDMADMNKNEDEGELVEDVFSDEDSIINNNQVNFSIYDTWSMDSHSGRSTPKIFSNRLEVPGMRHNSSSQDLTRLAKRKLLGSECSDLDNHDCPCDISSEGFQDENDIHHDGINTECLFGNHGDVENANAVLPSGGSGESEIVLERLDSSSTAANISSLESDSHPTTPVEKPPIPLVPKIILRGPSDSDMNKSIGDLLSDLRAELAMFSGDGSLPSSQQSSAASSPCPRRKNINHESTHPWEREQRDEGSEKHADNEKQCEERTIFQDFIVDSRSSPESMSIRNTRIGKSQSMDNVSCNSRNGNDKHVRSSTTEGTIPPGSPTRHKDCFPNCISRDRKTSWCSSDSRLDSHAGRGGNKTGSHGRVMGKEQPLLNTPLDCRLLARLGLSQRFLYEQMLRRQSEPIMAVAPVSPRLPTSARLSPEELSRKNNETKEKLKCKFYFILPFTYWVCLRH